MSLIYKSLSIYVSIYIYIYIALCLTLFTPGDLSVLVAVSSETRGFNEAALKTRYSSGNNTWMIEGGPP